MLEPFAVKDCALISIATGENAQNLRELRDRLQTIHPSSIYHHIWGGYLEARLEEPEYQNDFAAWAWHGLHDPRLAEKLAIIDPTRFNDLEDLRQELIGAIEERLDEVEYVPWSKPSQRFHFVRSQIVVFDTQLRIQHPGELRELIPCLTVGSVFYHFIDARRRTPNGINDFSEWIMNYGDEYASLARLLAGVDPYMGSLSELREEITAIVGAHGLEC